MSLYHAVLKSFLELENYRKYKDAVDENHLKENYPELFRIYQAVHHLHRDTGSARDYTLTDLDLALRTLYPRSNFDDYTPIFKAISETAFQPSNLHSYLDAIQKERVALEIARSALAVSEGRLSWEEFSALLRSQSALPEPSQTLLEGQFENDDLEYLKETQHTRQGLRWRLDSLNSSLGSLRKGDFGFLFARPETGKTTFLASETAFMAGQTDSPILWFNNEEQGGKVLLRCYQSALGTTLSQLYSNSAAHRDQYYDVTRRNIKLISDASISRGRVEQICQQTNPSLIIFDQIDKIRGFSSDRNDLELKEIYMWAREMAKQYAPVIGVCQAGSTGEGKRWLTMNDVDNSKTGKQGEADWILGIGKDHDEGHEGIRYLNLSKNKLLGDEDTDPSRRHDHWEVKIRPEIARYEDF